MKQKIVTKKSQSGFTIVELLAVMAIMTLLLGALVIDFSRQRGTRNVLLAKNEIATNLRKVQSYMLSSKNLPTGESVKFYVATFTDEATSYTIDAVDSNYVYHPNVETVNMPSLVKISNINYAITSKDEPPSPSYNCVQIIFSAPFGKMYTNPGSSCGSSIATVLRDPVQRASLSEKTSLIYFSKSDGTGTESRLEVNPITGQMTTY